VIVVVPDGLFPRAIAEQVKGPFSPADALTSRLRVERRLNQYQGGDAAGPLLRRQCRRLQLFDARFCGRCGNRRIKGEMAGLRHEGLPKPSRARRNRLQRGAA
jgi:hypothetical protein